VAEGLYVENIGISFKVTLEGGYEPTSWTRNTSAYETVVDGSGATGMRPVIDFFPGSGGATLDGFMVQNGDAYYHGGGVSIANGVDDVTVRDCKIVSNTAREIGGGISIIGNTNATITGCTLSGNTADTGGGLYIAEALSVTVANNLIASNTAISRGLGPALGGGVFIGDASRGMLRGNEIISNTATGDGDGRGGGIFLSDPGTEFTVHDNLIQRNRASDGGGGICVTWGADAIISNTQVLSNSTSQKFGGGILVGSVGTKADILDCLVVGNRGAEWGGGGIAVDWYSTASLIGNEILSNTCPAGNDGGGGIRVNNYATAEIKQNVLAHNRADSGAGVKVTIDCHTVISGNQIVSNTAVLGGGGVGFWQSEVAIAHNTVSWNHARGAPGLDLSHCTGTVHANTIAHNEVGDWGSGGMSIGGGSSLTVSNNVVVSNVGTVTWSDGDGISVWGDTTQAYLVNNTIAFNSAEGVQTADTSTVLIRNNVIVGNGGGIHDLYGQAAIANDHNDVWSNGWANYVNVVTGTGDISSDPLFVDPSQGDFHLQAGSPCIDTGTGTDAPSEDFEGDPRPLDGDLDGTPVEDIGTDEFKPHQIYLPLMLREA